MPRAISRPAPTIAMAITVRSLPEVVAVGTPGSGLGEGSAVAGSADGDPSAAGSVAGFELATDGTVEGPAVVVGGLVACAGVFVGFGGTGVGFGGGVPSPKTAVVEMSLAGIETAQAAP